jgi:hypothetical protein
MNSEKGLVPMSKGKLRENLKFEEKRFSAKKVWNDKILY